MNKTLLYILTLLLITYPVLSVVDADIESGNVLWFNTINISTYISGTTVIDRSGHRNGTLVNLSCSTINCTWTTKDTINLGANLNVSGNNFTIYAVFTFDGTGN